MFPIVLLIGIVCASVCDPSTSDHCDGGKESADSNDGVPRVLNMWATPLMIVRPKLKHGVSMHAFNTRLANRAIDTFNKFKQEAGSTNLIHTGASASGLNEAFFQWQRVNHGKDRFDAAASYNDLVYSSEFKAMIGMFESYADELLSRIGKSQSFINKRAKNLFCWATVSYNGLFHLSHTHPQSLLSGVYYAATPEGSGQIMFDDPRGPRHPFDGRHIHSPVAGDLIIFPSWLVHEVTPTLGDEIRVSFSINIPGSWEDTTDFNFEL